MSPALRVSSEWRADGRYVQDSLLVRWSTGHELSLRVHDGDE